MNTNIQKVAVVVMTLSIITGVFFGCGSILTFMPGIDFASAELVALGGFWWLTHSEKHA